MYHIYYVKGKKVGCTNNLEKRVEEEQGYSKLDYAVLHSTNCIATASKMEKHFQEKLGYKVDQIPYDKLPSNKLKYKIAQTTVTFGKEGDVITLEALMDLGVIRDESKVFLDYDIVLSDVVCKWILSNLKRSQWGYGNFVYLESLKNKFNVEIIEDENVWDNIRSWAKNRGLYEKGNVNTQYVKLMEESGELAKAILKEDEPEIIDAIGDIVVVLTNLAHLKGYKIEDCIASAYEVIKNRTGKMSNGTFVKDYSCQDMKDE